MRSEYSHPRDEDVLMVAGGELSGLRATRIRAHLAVCRACRARMEEITVTLTYRNLHFMVAITEGSF